jgi:hypothetical protein
VNWLGASALSLSRQLVLRLGLEVTSVVPLVQLGRRITIGAIYHPPSLYRWPCEDCVNPSQNILVFLRAQELACSVKAAPLYHGQWIESDRALI